MLLVIAARDVLRLSSYYEITSEWIATTTEQWTNWAQLQKVTNLPDNGWVQRLNPGFRSSWFGSVGVNRKPVWLKNLMLQAGSGFYKNLITDPVRSPRLRDCERIPISIWRHSRMPRVLTVQVVHLHEFVVGSSSMDFSASPGARVLIGKYSSSVNVFSVGRKLRSWPIW
jgi:hypothetical protein